MCYVPRELRRPVLGLDSDHADVSYLRVREEHGFEVGWRDCELRYASVTDSKGKDRRQGTGMHLCNRRGGMAPVSINQKIFITEGVREKGEDRPWKPLYLISSFFLSTIVKMPSSSRTAMSPVLNHPSGVIEFFVAVGLFKYPLITIK